MNASDKERIYYRGLNLNRASEQRKDAAWLKTQWRDDNARVLLVHNDQHLMQWNRDSGVAPVAMSHHRDEVASLLPQYESMVFLGLDQQIPWFAADVSAVNEADILALSGETELIDLREAGWLLAEQEAGLLAYARGLLYWNNYHGFCSKCGSESESQQGGHLRVCRNDSCGRLHFPRTDPAVIMLIEDTSDPANPRCLLGRNSRFRDGLVSTLAGFVDPLESLEECVVRESFEEAGVRVDQVRYQASQPWPFPSSIMLGFRARAITTEIVVDGVEIAEAHWFTPAQLKTFGEWGDSGYCLPRQDSIARYLIESWMADVKT